jgi:RNA polymerase sigma-70 factor, ECF subfamily
METSVSLIERLASQPTEPDWSRLHELYQPLLRHWIERAGVASNDSDDLIQDVMLVILREISHFVYRHDGSFRAWIRQIVANRLKNFFRSRSYRPASLGGSDFQSQLDELESPESTLSRLWDREHDLFVANQLMKRVQPDFTVQTWTAFTKHVVQGKPAQEVAIELELSLNAVILAKSRILRRIRAEAEGLVDLR